MPQLIEAGRVYKSIPPLYGINKGNKMQYFTDQLDFVKYVQKIFLSTYTIADITTKKPLSNKDITVLFMNNEEYVYELESVATTYAVDSRLLELALFAYLKNDKINNVSKALKSEFRFMNVSQDKYGNFIYDGTIKETNFLHVGDKLIGDCSRIINIINKNREYYYLMNGKLSSIYEIMKAFDSIMPSKKQRYKGLGEMSDEQLAESTLLPTSDRLLIRYTLEDAKDELSIIREFESDRSKLLGFVKNVKRIELLD